jgi:hypothetical protein
VRCVTLTVLEGAKEMLALGGLSEAVPLAGAQVSADSNYHSEENLKACEAHGVDAYIPDTHFRQRDPRFATQGKHKVRERQEQPRKGGFSLEDFAYDAKSDCFICPAGKRLELEAATAISPRGRAYRRYQARAQDCSVCPLQKVCLLKRAGVMRRTLHVPREERAATAKPPPPSLSQKMQAKIDLPESRKIYSQRLAIVEPVFANLRSNKGMDHFTYRGNTKANVQWLLYCLVHNLEKIAHFGASFRKKWRLFRALQRLMSFLHALYNFICTLLTYFSSVLHSSVVTDTAPRQLLPANA